MLSDVRPARKNAGENEECSDRALCTRASESTQNKKEVSMKYEIKGGAFPVVVCELENGEQMITEKGSMVWMSPNMQMDTAGQTFCFIHSECNPFLKAIGILYCRAITSITNENIIHSTLTYITGVNLIKTMS